MFFNQLTWSHTQNKKFGVLVSTVSLDFTVSFGCMNQVLIKYLLVPTGT